MYSHVISLTCQTHNICPWFQLHVSAQTGSETPLVIGVIEVVQLTRKVMLWSCRCLKTCQDVAVACRTDLQNSLLCCTIYTSPETPAEEIFTEVASCLNTFLNEDIHTSFRDMHLSTDRQPDNHASLSSDLGTRQSVIHDTASGAASAARAASSDEDASCEDDVSIDADAIDDYLKPPVMHRHWQPLVTVIGVPALPKGALVEVQPEAFTVDALTTPASSSSSSDDDDEAGVDAVRGSTHAQTASSRMSGWPGQLQHEQSLDGEHNGMQWQSLTSHGVYCSCQISFSVGDNLNAVKASFQDAADVAVQKLTSAGLTAGHVMHACIYVQHLGHAEQQQLESAFDSRWWSHDHTLKMLVVSASSISCGLGSELHAPKQSEALLQLTAHAGH